MGPVLVVVVDVAGDETFELSVETTLRHARLLDSYWRARAIRISASWSWIRSHEQDIRRTRCCPTGLRPSRLRHIIGPPDHSREPRTRLVLFQTHFVPPASLPWLELGSVDDDTEIRRTERVKPRGSAWSSARRASEIGQPGTRRSAPGHGLGVLLVEGAGFLGLVFAVELKVRIERWGAPREALLAFAGCLLLVVLLVAHGSVIAAVLKADNLRSGPQVANAFLLLDWSFGVGMAAALAATLVSLHRIGRPLRQPRTRTFKAALLSHAVLAGLTPHAKLLVEVTWSRPDGSM